MKIEQIVFLGAGASAADGAPIQNRLLKNTLIMALKMMHLATILVNFLRSFLA